MPAPLSQPQQGTWMPPHLQPATSQGAAAAAAAPASTTPFKWEPEETWDGDTVDAVPPGLDLEDARQLPRKISLETSGSQVQPISVRLPPRQAPPEPAQLLDDGVDELFTGVAAAAAAAPVPTPPVRLPAPPIPINVAKLGNGVVTPPIPLKRPAAANGLQPTPLAQPGKLPFAVLFPVPPLPEVCCRLVSLDNHDCLITRNLDKALTTCCLALGRADHDHY